MKVEQAKCETPNQECKLCWTCQRKGTSEDDNYAEFTPKETMMNGWQCNGYVSENQGSLSFDT